MFFSGLNTINEIKSEYRRLAKINHPDRGGDTETMQKINAAYHAALETLDGRVSVGTDGKRHTYRYNHDVEQEVMDKVLELLSLNLPNVQIEVIGTWVWVNGDTRPVKEQLKSLGLRWHGKRQMWYWRRFTYRRRMSKMSTDDLRKMYGNRMFTADQDAALVTRRV